MTAEQKAARRKAAEEKRQAEQQQRDEEEKKAIEAQIAARKKNPLAPVISDSFRAAIAQFKSSEEDEEEEDWDEEEDVVASTATTVTNPEPVITPVSPVAVTAAVDKPSLPQEQIHTPEVSVKREPIVAQSQEVKAEDRSALTNSEPVITPVISPVTATAVAVDKPSLPQEQIYTPEVSVKREPIVAQSQEVKADGRSALLQAIRNGVTLKKQEAFKEQQKEVTPTVLAPKAPEAARPKLPDNLLSELAKDNKAKLKPADVKHTQSEEVLTHSKEESVVPSVKETVSVPKEIEKPNVIGELQQNTRFKRAKESADNQAINPVMPTTASSIHPSENEWNQGFNRIRQRNIPFQYVPEADLKKGIEAFNQKKAAKANPVIAEIEQPMPKPTVVSEPQMAVIAKPAPTVDTDRDYALALHLDELQRSDKASDRELADNPDYLRSLQEAYDNDNKRNTEDFEQLEVSAQKEVRHQNLEKEPQANVVATPKPRAHQRRRPQTPVELRQSAQDRYVGQSLSLTVMILVEQRSFELTGTSANLFMSCSCMCLSYHESISLNKDGSISHSVSQSLSYTQTNIALSDKGESIVSTSLALSYNKQVSLSSCPSMSFFGKSAASKSAAMPKALNIDVDTVSPIGLPAASAA